MNDLSDVKNFGLLFFNDNADLDGDEWFDDEAAALRRFNEAKDELDDDEFVIFVRVKKTAELKPSEAEVTDFEDC